MLKKVLIGLLALVVVGSIGLYFLARSVFTHDSVRAAIAEQLSTSLGQPVAIGGISASIYPRVTMNLSGVAIGRPARIQVAKLEVGTDFRALLSRRIEHAALRLTGATIELPLPAFAVPSAPPPPSGDSRSSSVEIVSIDEIALRDVTITSGGRTLRGDIEVVPQGQGVAVRRIALVADGATIEITGQITDLSGPVGELSITSGALNFDELLAFVSDFAGSAGAAASGGAPPARTADATAGRPVAMNIGVSLEAEGAAMGGLSLQKLSGRARITPAGMALEPIRFGMFGGNFDGALTLTLAETPAFRLNAALSGVDMGAVTTFAGSPDTITGRLTGTLELSGRGMDAASVLRSTRGTARVEITNGTVKRLGLVRTILLATSGRSGAVAQSATNVSNDEPFARLAATLAVANGSASTADLRFESNDLLLTAAGVVRLDGASMNLAGDVQLSDKLSAQVGRDLVRYTQDQGRVTLPVVITGSADNPRVRIDVASVARRAITNRAKEEVQGAVKKGLGGLFGR